MTSAHPPTSGEPLSATEEALRVLVDTGRCAAPYELAALVDVCARALGAQSAVVYLADLQQRELVPFLAPSGPGQGAALTPLSVDATLAGRAFQTFELQVQDTGGEAIRAWYPLLAGTDRVGVLAVTVADVALLQGHGGRLGGSFVRLATAAADLVATRTLYGDTLVRLRRSIEMGLAAEMQWSLLPPLTFASHPVTVTAALEPAYNVAGDTVDYAVDAGVTHVAIFDVMGHGLHSAQSAVLCVAAYRNARRSGSTLADSLRRIDDALLAGLGGEVFATTVLAQLHTDTGLLEWVNAGHPEPLLLRDGKLIRSLHTQPGPPVGLGLAEPVQPVVGQEQLEPGDRVLLFTDGVVEARSPAGDFFGTERLADLVLRHLAGGLAAAETMRRVVRELLEHHQDQLSDDASLLLVQWNGEVEPGRVGEIRIRTG